MEEKYKDDPRVGLWIFLGGPGSLSAAPSDKLSSEASGLARSPLEGSLGPPNPCLPAGRPITLSLNPLRMVIGVVVLSNVDEVFEHSLLVL